MNWSRLGFCGSGGFGAEVRNGLGLPTTSEISAASSLRLFPPGLLCAPAQPQPPLPPSSLSPPSVAQLWGLEFGYFRLVSSISASAIVSRSLPGTLTGPRQGAPSLSRADAGCFTSGTAIPTCPTADRGGGCSKEVLVPEVTNTGVVVTAGHSLGLGQGC